MEKTLEQVYKKQNSAHLLAHAHELKVTPFTTTINIAWKLLRDYKGDDSFSSPQLPSQERTNISVDKRIWTEGDIQREPHIRIKSWHQRRYHLGHDLRHHPLSPWDETEADESHRHSTHLIHPTPKFLTRNSTKPLPGRKLRKC